MVIIDNKLISDDVFKVQFVCKLDACKGACCREGDYGAPLSKEEVDILHDIYLDVKPFLTQEGIDEIEINGSSVYLEKQKEYATPLIEGGPCAYIVKDEIGIERCGIEMAWLAGKTYFQKPISCHLYPIRTKDMGDYEALNYDEWDICAAACSYGKELKVPVWQFLKDAIVRKYGLEFYEQLEATARHLEESKDQGSLGEF